MHAGTTRVASGARSAMRKRRHTAGPSERDAVECPICYSTLTARTEKRPFQCNHVMCATCHARMLDEDDHRCPECRAPRVGFSRDEAEPDPARNHVPPTLDDLIADMPPGLRDMLELMNDPSAQPPNMASGAARGYGLPPGPRPNTGHAMFFAVQPPTDWAPNPRERAASDTRMPVDLLGSANLPQGLAHTLIAMNAIPEEAISGLLNIPEVPLEEWHRQRRGSRSSLQNIAAAGRSHPRSRR